MTHQTLANYINAQSKPLLLDTALEIIQQIATLLDEAHAQGLVHLGLTPETVWITDNGKAKISSFQTSSQAIEQASTEGQSITPYTPPELVRNALNVDHHADIYSLGAIAYTLLLGQPPFVASTTAGLTQQIMERPPLEPELLQAEIAQSMAFVLKAALAKEPVLRYASAGDFANALRQGRLWVPRMTAAAPATLFKPSVDSAKLDHRGKQKRRQSGRHALLVAIMLTIMLTPIVFFRNEMAQQLLPKQLGLSASTVAQATNTPNLAPSQLPSTRLPDMPTATSQVLSEVAGLQRLTSTATITEPSPQMVSVLPTATVASISGNVFLDQALEITATSTVTVTPLLAIPVTITTPLAGVQPQVLEQSIEVTPAPPTLAVTSSLTVTVAITSSLADNQPQSEGVKFDFYLPLIARNPTLSAVVIKDANLRAGPGTRYPTVGSARAKTEIVLVACNQGCTWYQLASGGWIAAFLVADVPEVRQTLPVMIE